MHAFVHTRTHAQIHTKALSRTRTLSFVRVYVRVAVIYVGTCIYSIIPRQYAVMHRCDVDEECVFVCVCVCVYRCVRAHSAWLHMTSIDPSFFLNIFLSQCQKSNFAAWQSVYIYIICTCK